MEFQILFEDLTECSCQKCHKRRKRRREIDDEISIEDLDDVEKSLMKMTTATLFWRKAKSERCWRRRGNKNDKKSQKKDHVEVRKTAKKQRRLQ